MGAPRTGPCSDWTTVDDVRANCARCSDDTVVSDAAVLVGIEVASEVLFHLSGRQYAGTCEATVRPCLRASWTPRWWVVEYGSAPWGVCGCGSDGPSACSCAGGSSILLGASPVVSIDEVKVDGVVLDPSTYRIDGYRWLTRVDGEAWPACQRIDLDDTEAGTFSVAYTYGSPPGPAGEHAARELACEVARACSDVDCALPERVTQVTAQGVTMVALDPFDFLEKGKVGVFAVDLFLAAVNPKGRRRPAVIVSPDVSPTARRVGT